MRKRILAVAICVCLVLSMGQATIAAPGRTIVSGGVSYQARWAHISSIDLSLSSNGGWVTWTGTVRGHPGTTSIVVRYTLEWWNGTRWEFVGSWGDSGTSHILASTGSAPGVSGLYRLTIDVTVTRNGSTERVVLSHEQWL